MKELDELITRKEHNVECEKGYKRLSGIKETVHENELRLLRAVKERMDELERKLNEEVKG